MIKLFKLTFTKEAACDDFYHCPELKVSVFNHCLMNISLDVSQDHTNILLH